MAEALNIEVETESNEKVKEEQDKLVQELSSMLPTM